MTDFTDRKFYLLLMSGEMLDFTDRKFYLALMSGKMDSFADGCKTTRILRINGKSRLVNLVLLPLWYGNKDIIRDNISKCHR